MDGLGWGSERLEGKGPRAGVLAAEWWLWAVAGWRISWTNDEE